MLCLNLVVHIRSFCSVYQKTLGQPSLSILVPMAHLAISDASATWMTRLGPSPLLHQGSAAVLSNPFPLSRQPGAHTMSAYRPVYLQCWLGTIPRILCTLLLRGLNQVSTHRSECPSSHDSQHTNDLNCRKNTLIYGLNWHSGEVTCTEGTVVQAKAIFELWKKLGHVMHLRWDRKFVVDIIFHEAD